MSESNPVDISLEYLPKTWTRTDRKFGLVVSLMAIVIPGIPVAFLALVDSPPLLMAIPVLLVMLPLLTWGINLMASRTTFTVTEQEVTMDERTLFRHTQWAKPPSFFKLMNTVVYGRTGDGSERSGRLTCTYTIILVHKKPGTDLEVPLYQTDDLESAVQRMALYHSHLGVKVEERLFNYNLARAVSD
ncbi:MAG: hypothetical protein ACKVH8_24135 [Pirellulales bacterium]|jgi:hypothetical protein